MVSYFSVWPHYRVLIRGVPHFLLSSLDLIRCSSFPPFIPPTLPPSLSLSLLPSPSFLPFLPPSFPLPSLPPSPPLSLHSREGMIIVNNSGLTGDPTCTKVEIDRRMLDFCVGLDTEFSEIVEGSHLYFPQTKFEQVQLQYILNTVCTLTCTCAHTCIWHSNWLQSVLQCFKFENTCTCITCVKAIKSYFRNLGRHIFMCEYSVIPPSLSPPSLFLPLSPSFTPTLPSLSLSLTPTLLLSPLTLSDTR